MELAEESAKERGRVAAATAGRHHRGVLPTNAAAEGPAHDGTADDDDGAADAVSDGRRASARAR